MTNLNALQIIAEQRIQDAMARGEFDNLPGQGKPLKLDDMENVPEDLRMAYKILKNANCLPPDISQRKEIGNLYNLLDNCPDEQKRLRTVRRLRFLMDNICSDRHLALEAQDEYYQKILARLEKHERK